MSFTGTGTQLPWVLALLLLALLAPILLLDSSQAVAAGDVHAAGISASAIVAAIASMCMWLTAQLASCSVQTLTNKQKARCTVQQVSPATDSLLQ